MGFFLSDTEQQSIAKHRPIPNKGVTTKKATAASILAGGVGCDNCTLRKVWGTIVSPKMPLHGDARNAEILVLGEAPGETEDREGVPFVGKSGSLLRKHLKSHELPIIAFQNTVRCRPEQNRTPTPQEAHACSIHLDADIASLPKLKAILGVGSVPLQRFFPGGQIGKVYGTQFPVKIEDRTVWYYPIFHPSYVLRMREESKNSDPVGPVFAADMHKFFSEWRTWRKPEVIPLDPSKVIVPTTKEEALSLIAGMKGPRAVDIETSGIIKDTVPKPYHNSSLLITAAISDGDTAIAFAVDHPEVRNRWGLDVLLTCVENYNWIAHNVQYELAWFLYLKQRLGRTKPLAIFEDTMALGRLYHERETIQSLEDMSQIHLGTNVKAIMRVDTSNMLKHALSDVYKYNALDVLATAQIYHKLCNKVNRGNYERILATQESTARMEVIGLPVSMSAAKELREKWQAVSDKEQAEAKTIYEVRQFELIFQKEFNIASGDHIATALTQFGRVDLPKTKSKKKDGGKESGKFSTDNDALTKYAGDNPLAKCVLAYREANVIISTFIDSVAENVEKASDGQFHAGYTVTLTSTGRLSSTPQIQNWPKRKNREVRRQIVAPPGHILAAFDEGQLEARVIAMVTKDKALCKSILADHDIHYDWLNKALAYYPEYLTRLAETTNLVGAKEEKIRKRGRDTIKGDFVFAAFFGSGSKNIAGRTGIPRDKVEALLEELWSTYPTVRNWVRDRRKEYETTGSSRSLTGRVRHGILWGQEPINNPVQGTGADIVLAAMNELSQLSVEVDDPYLHPRFNVHDDLSFILPENNDLPLYIETIQEAMVKVRWDWQIVPLIVECKIGPNWADLEEIPIHKGDYVKT